MIRAVIFDCFGVLTGTGGDAVNKDLFVFMRDILKPKYKLGMLSNAGSDMLNELFEPWQASLFDDVILSYQTGMVKPDPGIYELAANRLGVLAEECIFVDDIESFCDMANTVGMKAVFHKDTDKTIRKIMEFIRA